MCEVFILPKYNQINALFCIFLTGCIVFLIVAPFVLLPKINPDYRLTPIERDGVFLEMWEVDTFEGGTNARSKFLEKVAIQYQKEHRGVYVIVRNLSLEQCQIMLGQDKIPDIISFGTGAGNILCAYTQKLEISSNIRQSLLNSGQIAGVQYALPWCMGGYVLCSQADKKLTYGVGQEFNVAPNLMCDNLKKYNTQYDAYKAFCNNEFDVLVGTQRDYYRLSNKLNLGVIDNCKFEFNNEYSDLVQYVSITTQDDKYFVYAQSFLKFIVSDKIQMQLKDIGMFGVSDQRIYKNTTNEEFEKSILSIKQIPNAFVSLERIRELQS